MSWIIIVSRVLLLENHHSSIDDILRPLAHAASLGILVETSNQKRLRMQIVIESHVYDNPRSENLFVVKHGNHKNCPFFLCLLFKSDVNKSEIGNSHTLGHTLRTPEILSCNDRAQRKMLDELSTLPVRSTCSIFPMLMVHPTKEIYRIFREQSIEDFCHRVWPLIKELNWKYTRWWHTLQFKNWKEF